MYLTASSRIGQDERLAIDRNRRAGDHVVCERLDQVIPDVRLPICVPLSDVLRVILELFVLTHPDVKEVALPQRLAVRPGEVVLTLGMRARVRSALAPMRRSEYFSSLLARNCRRRAPVPMSLGRVLAHCASISPCDVVAKKRSVLVQQTSVRQNRPEEG
jgi:hypothetical protein